MLASLRSYPSAGPPLSVEKTMIVLLSIPRSYRARVTFPTESSSAHTIASKKNITDITMPLLFTQHNQISLASSMSMQASSGECLFHIASLSHKNAADAILLSCRPDCSPCPHTRTLDPVAMKPYAAPVCGIMVSIPVVCQSVGLISQP